MQSRKLSSSSTSVRRNKSVPSACIRSSDQLGDFSVGRDFDRRLPATENSRAGFSFQRYGTIFDQQPRSFANADDRRFIFLEKLQNAFLLGLPQGRGIRRWIVVVRSSWTVQL